MPDDSVLHAEKYNEWFSVLSFLIFLCCFKLISLSGAFPLRHKLSVWSPSQLTHIQTWGLRGDGVICGHHSESMDRHEQHFVLIQLSILLAEHLSASFTVTRGDSADPITWRNCNQATRFFEWGSSKLMALPQSITTMLIIPPVCKHGCKVDPSGPLTFSAAFTTLHRSGNPFSLFSNRLSKSLAEFWSAGRKCEQKRGF